MQLLCMLVCVGPVHAQSLVVADTKLRINVAQWSPISGTYEQWSALGGDYVVSSQGTISVPVVGNLPVLGLEDHAIAMAYADALRARTGLVSPPEVTVQIIQYPPIYVVGEVESPGPYDFRPGLTALHALALGGGERLKKPEDLRDGVRADVDLRTAENAIALGQVRLARLEAERTGSAAISFPEIRSAYVSAQYAAELVERERTIFHARKRELDRQRAAISELRDLLKAEIDVLEQKLVMSDKAIATADEELASVSTLVERGIAVTSRRSDLARLLDSMQASRLDQTTAIMRARQNIAAATRDLDGLDDQFQTSVAAELQAEKAKLEELKLERQLALQLLEDAPDRKTLTPASAKAELVYSIVRMQDGARETLPADAATALLPGDVVRIEFAVPEAEDSGAAGVEFGSRTQG